MQNNIKDRYYGTNDPVAEKIVARVLGPQKLMPPEDRSITTVFIAGITDDITESDLRCGAARRGREGGRR